MVHDPSAAQIVKTARSLPPAERESYVAEATRRDPSLAQAVRRLLQEPERGSASPPAAPYPPEPGCPGDSHAAAVPPALGGRTRILSLAELRQNDATVHADGLDELIRAGNPAASPAAVAEAAAHPIDPATRFGPYRPLRELGRGGMSVVYLAEQQEPLRRQVAIKVVPPGRDSVELSRRFEQERQALARLNHPNIADVYDAGELPDGRPYFVMEYIPGRPITSYCDEQRLTLAARLRLFAAVCHAVHHANQRGIVHRDLKPSNILVSSADGVAIPKVIDFSTAAASIPVAQSVNELDRPGVLIGTPQYMSPEQARGEAAIDARSDVFTLGTLLFELICGQPPFREDGGSLAGLLREVVQTQAPAPSDWLAQHDAQRACRAAACGTSPRRLLSAVRGDIDAIVGRALEKPPNQRYPSARDMADDVERHLHRRRISIPLPPGLAFRSWLRRHRTLLPVAALTLAALLVGVLIQSLT